MGHRIHRWEDFLLKENKDYFDNPKAIKTLKDYTKTVESVKNMTDDARISEFIIDYIHTNEEKLAQMILEDDSEYIYCEHAAQMVSMILKDAGIPHKLIVGNIRKTGHSWVQLNDTVIDPTASQFRGKVSLDEYTQGIEKVWEE